MRNTEDDDTDDEVEDIDLDHYKDDPRLKIFGNPTVKKTQSFSYTKKATPVYEALVTSGCQNTPSNTPHSSSPLSTSPVSSSIIIIIIIISLLLLLCITGLLTSFEPEADGRGAGIAGHSSSSINDPSDYESCRYVPQQH